jgi:hypothetical protein
MKEGLINKTLYKLTIGMYPNDRELGFYLGIVVGLLMALIITII